MRRSCRVASGQRVRRADAGRHRFRRVALVLGVLSGTSAVGVREAGATDWNDLRGLSSCPDGIEVQLTEKVDRRSETLVVGCEATLDLNGQELIVASVDVRSDLTITDSAGGGRLDASDQYFRDPNLEQELDYPVPITEATAGIHVPAGTSLTILGGEIIAAGGPKTAGIGSLRDEDAGDVTIVAGSIRAQGGDRSAGIGSAWGGAGGRIRVEGGTVEARGGAHAAAIGTACWPADAVATLYVGEGATVTAIGAPMDVACDAPALRLGGDAPFLEVHGTLRLEQHHLNWVIPAPTGDGPSVVVGPTGTITGSVEPEAEPVRITGEGSITNQGVMGVDATDLSGPVTGHDFRLMFQPATTEMQQLRVLAPDFASAALVAPPHSPDAGWWVAGEERWWSAAEPLTHDLVLVESPLAAGPDTAPPDPIGAPADSAPAAGSPSLDQQRAPELVAPGPTTVPPPRPAVLPETGGRAQLGLVAGALVGLGAIAAAAARRAPRPDFHRGRR